ncbi:MAG: YlxR family protein [Clostridia bacterium]|nr:YlxR family protein [Clostridia bacterium]
MRVKKNNPIERTCVVCRSKKDKSDLIRIAKLSNGDICVDKTGRTGGRGCYVCADPLCLEKMYKVRALNRAFKTNFGEDVYDRIRNEL